jgi:hypothetical protein
MPALLTHHDRQVYRLQLEIERHERWLSDAHGDRRAQSFHRAKLAELRRELAQLED